MYVCVYVCVYMGCVCVFVQVCKRHSAGPQGMKSEKWYKPCFQGGETLLRNIHNKNA